MTEVQPQLAAIENERLLLSDPDPLPPLVATLIDALRGALQAAAQRYSEAHRQAIVALEQAAEWSGLSDDQRRQILETHTLDQTPTARFGSDAELIASLEGLSIADWATRTAALPERAARAREAAARLLEPKAVTLSLPRRTLKSSAELDAYLNELRTMIQQQLDAGTPVII